VEITKIRLSENIFTANGNSWDVPTLIRHCEEEDLQVFDVPLAGISLDTMPFDMRNFRDFVHHCNRVISADLSKPIIFDSLGNVCDGFHRIAKAIIEHHPTIKARRIVHMPSPSGKEPPEENK